MILVNRRAFLSMARMITFPWTHLAADFENSKVPSFLTETLWEILEARKVINLILVHNGIKISPVSSSQTEGWVISGVEGQWDIPGDETITIPALSGRYLKE